MTYFFYIIGAAALAWLCFANLPRLRGKSPPPTIREPKFELRFDSSGFRVMKLKEPTAEPSIMAWDEIQKLVVYKRDLFAVDLICLQVLRGDGASLELDEEMPGWKEWVAALPRHLPGCQPSEQWWHDVAFPAFATNLREIFSRPIPVQSAKGLSR